MTSLLSTGAGVLLFVGLVGALGAVVGRWAVLPSASDEPPTPWLRTRAAGYGLAAGAVLVVAMAAVFARQLAEFRDPFVPWTEDAALLLGTPWGTRWMSAAAATALTLVAFGVLRFRDGVIAWVVASVGVAGLCFFPALTGHASGGSVPAWLVPADALHVAAAGAWMGGLGLVLHLERRWRGSRAEAHATLLPDLVPRFSPVAVASVGVLGATGLAASWIHLPSPASLLAPGYGRVLLLKLLLVAVVLALGALNWKRHTPRLPHPDGPGRLRRAAAVELALGTLVLVVTAVLVRTSPGGG